MKYYLICIALPILLGSGCSDGRDSRACKPVDPVEVELGGINYSIPASYQPRFSHKLGQENNFYVFLQHYYKDGKRLKNRYCKQEGTHKVEGMSFDLEFGNSRRNDGYDVRDAIVPANSPRFDALDNMTFISIHNVPSSIEPEPTHPFYKDAALSKNGLYYFKGSSENAEGICKEVVSTNSTVFGGKVRASCLISFVKKPQEATWRLSIAADRLGKPHGSLTVDVRGKSFEEWPPILDGVKAFIESMRDAHQ